MNLPEYIELFPGDGDIDVQVKFEGHDGYMPSRKMKPNEISALIAQDGMGFHTHMSFDEWKFEISKYEIHPSDKTLTIFAIIGGGIELSEFKFKSNENEHLDRDFLLVLSDFKFDTQELKHLNPSLATNVPGVYFVVMRLEDDSRYKIYVGKTKSLKRRLNDYTNPLQIQAPNDYKLRLFRDFIRKHYSTAEFDIYFCRCDIDDYTKLETDKIKYYLPLINQPSKVDKSVIQSAFETYFLQTFRQKLAGGG